MKLVPFFTKNPIEYMHTARKFPKKVKFICSFIHSDINKLSRLKVLMVKKFGPIDYESESIKFDFTDYYREEMGPRL